MPISAIYNASAARSARQLEANDRDMATSLERLSTGQRINRAKDDPSGLTASESLKVQRKVLNTKIQQAAQEYARYSALEGGLGAVGELFTELRSLVLQSANTGGLSEQEREGLQTQADGIIKGISAAMYGTRFKGELLLQGYLTGGSITVPPSEGSNSSESKTFTNASALNSFASGGVSNLVSGDRQQAAALAETLENFFVVSRADVGKQMKRIESEVALMKNEDQGLAQELSQLLDTDYAKEVGELVRTQVLQQASIATIKIAQDVQAQTVLDLLRGNLDDATKLAETSAESASSRTADAA